MTEITPEMQAIVKVLAGHMAITTAAAHLVAHDIVAALAFLDEGPQPPAPPQLRDELIVLNVKIEREVTSSEVAEVTISINPADYARQINLDVIGAPNACWIALLHEIVRRAETTVKKRGYWITVGQSVYGAAAPDMDTDIIRKAIYKEPAPK